MSWRWSIFLALLAGPSTAGAQPVAAPPLSPLRWQVRNTTRVEMWRFFQPRPGGGDPTYAFIANRLLVTADYLRPRVDVRAAVQYVQFGGLPTNASGPGPLGTGSQYFEHAGRSRGSRQAYVRSLAVRLKNARRGMTLQLGRFGYASGAESASGDTKIEAVKRQRLDSRLIGEFEWSLYQRSFDGVRLDVDRPAGHATALWVRPTQGGFEEQAGYSLKQVGIGAASVSIKPGPAFRHTDWQAFVYRYSDHRLVTARPDNTLRAAASVDVGVTSLGSSLVGAYPVPRGQIDVLGWWVWQGGRWYEQPHRASAFAAELGYQRTGARLLPWLRAGWFRSSGDDNPTDDRHRTFFQVLPTARRYSLSTAYNLMNLTDTFAQALWRVADVTVRADAARLRLTHEADLWYAGSGATESTGSAFGFAGRRSNGSRALGTMVEGSVDWVVTPHLSANGYVGHLRGGRVVTDTFAGKRLTFGYVETVVSF